MSRYRSAADTPTLGKIVKGKGIAGQFSLTVETTYRDCEPSTVTFVGSGYGGPVVMLTDSIPGGTFVSDPQRFGTFGEQWVRSFFGHA